MALKINRGQTATSQYKGDSKRLLLHIINIWIAGKMAFKITVLLKQQKD